jgi:hypothetical protein
MLGKNFNLRFIKKGAVVDVLTDNGTFEFHRNSYLLLKFQKYGLAKKYNLYLIGFFSAVCR